MGIDMQINFSDKIGFIQILDRSADVFPQHTAIICGSDSRTYAQLKERSCRLANALRKRGIRKGSMVAIISPNCIEYEEIEFACARIGAVIVKINWRLSPEEMKYLIEYNDVSFMFCCFTQKDWKNALLASLDPMPEMIEISDSVGKQENRYEQMIEEADSSVPQTDMEADHILMHIHTSGTTGRPKCVMYTHSAMLREIESAAANMQFEHGDVYQMMSQLFHSACVGCYLTLATGGTAVIFPKFDSVQYMRSVEQHHVTRLSAIPTVLKALLSHPDFGRFDLSSIRFIHYSTCPMPPALIREAMERIRGCQFIQSYGMTEMCAIVTTLLGNDHTSDQGRHLYTIGRPLSGYEIAIEREDGIPALPGECGEILIKGPSMMKGYYKDPEATKQALRGGWYHTGDMGLLDGDGYLVLRGRNGDMMISGGENIYPKEIEDVLMQLTGQIAEAAVFAVPDDYWGERPAACVRPVPGAQPKEQQLIAYCRERLAHYKVPKRIYVVEHLPRTPSGKVKKHLLAERYRI